jgi:predicted Rossmann fold flavoprotein
MNDNKTLVVIGGGAAGFFCAVNAARLQPTLKVIILEKSGKLLSKVKVSGGGRCNVTHACFEIPELIKRYPRGQNFVKKTFHRFNPTHTIQWFEERGVKLKTESDGRMFPVTDSSQTIIDCLLHEVHKYDIEVRMNYDVEKIIQKEKFKIQNRTGSIIEADYVCIACGGFPKSSQFDWLKELGHTINEPVPSLFTFNMPGNAITELMGVSVENATVKIVGTKLQQQGPLLITHWGLSGPAVLKLSAFAARELAEKKYEFDILVNWLKDYNEQQLRDEWKYLRDQYASQHIGNKNPFGLPNRLWLFLLNECGIKPETRWSDLSSSLQNKLILALTAHPFKVKGKTTFKEEFVTSGGINLSEVDANTMESKKVANIFFAGEIVDVDGITGGFNFQHAWTSGFIAAKTITERCNKKSEA